MHTVRDTDVRHCLAFAAHDAMNSELPASIRLNRLKRIDLKDGEVMVQAVVRVVVRQLGDFFPRVHPVRHQRHPALRPRTGQYRYRIRPTYRQKTQTRPPHQYPNRRSASQTHLLQTQKRPRFLPRPQLPQPRGRRRLNHSNSHFANFFRHFSSITTSLA